MLQSSNTLTSTERRASWSLALIFAFRLLGLFMLLPLFTLYAQHLGGASATLIGFSFGIYGLTQAAFQMPLGMLSDYVGRKPVIVLGLILLALGSVIAALSNTIFGITLGRGIQGAGAIGAVIIATVADLSREEHRAKAMTSIGIVIGSSFIGALILGPMISAMAGVRGIFWFTFLLALAGMGIVYLIPTPPKTHPNKRFRPSFTEQFVEALAKPELVRLSLGVFCLHMILTASFSVIPLSIMQYGGLDINSQWRVYLPVFLISFVVAVPTIIVAEKKQLFKQVFLTSLVIIILSQLAFIFVQYTLNGILAALFFFLAPFTALEILLPSLVSVHAPPENKGTAIGIYSCAQFLGIFVGGVIGGWLFDSQLTDSIFLFCAAIGCMWLAIASNMSVPDRVIPEKSLSGFK